MKYTVSLPEITKVIMTNAPQELPGDEKESLVSIYIQDCTAHIDFYIMSWHRESGCFFALVDPLPDPQVLDLEYVSFSFLRDHDLFYSVETGITSEPVSHYSLSRAACDNFVKLALSFSIHLICIGAP